MGRNKRDKYPAWVERWLKGPLPRERKRREKPATERSDLLRLGIF